MKRFLLALALVAVAGATYVATAPGSQTRGPTAAQFKALRNEVGHLKDLVKADHRLLKDCMVVAVPITRRGDWQDENQTFGYSYSDPTINTGTPFLTTALDSTTPDDSSALWITGGLSNCGADLGTARRKVGRLAGVRLHLVTRSFSAHGH